MKNMPWKQFLTNATFPWIHVALIIIGILLSTWGDHHTIFYSMRDQVIEEMAELLMYLALYHAARYVYENQSNKSHVIGTNSMVQFSFYLRFS